MKKYYLYKQICFLLLLIFITPCYGQAGQFMFHGAIKDKAGNLWFATYGAGVYRYKPSTELSTGTVTGGFTNFTEKDGLCSNSVSSMLEDKAGNLWFSTESGVCRYNPSDSSKTGSKSFITIITKDSVHQNFGYMLEDKEGKLWFSTNGYGICRYEPASGKLTSFKKEQGLGSNFIQCMLEDKAGILWVGSRAGEDGGVCRYDSASGRFTKFNGECFNNQIMSIVEDKTGNIWFANLYNGLCRYEPVSGGFTHFTEKDGTCGNIVTSMYLDKKGNLWFSSSTGQPGNRQEGGLCRYDGKSFTGFTAKDGISHSEVWTIIEDNEGNMWVGTKGGLYRYHSPSGKFINYTHKVNNSN